MRSSDWLKQGLESEQTNKSLKQKLGQLEIEKKCHLHSVRNEPVRKKPATQFFLFCNTTLKPFLGILSLSNNPILIMISDYDTSNSVNSFHDAQISPVCSVTWDFRIQTFYLMLNLKEIFVWDVSVKKSIKEHHGCLFDMGMYHS